MWGTLWRETLRACTARLAQGSANKHRYDNRMRDLLSQLNAAAGPAPGAEARAVVRQALTLLEIGHSVIEVRELVATSTALGAATQALGHCVASIAAWLRTRRDGDLQAAIEATLRAGACVREAQLGAGAERALRLQTALADLHSLYTSLLDHMAPAAGDVHAA